MNLQLLHGSVMMDPKQEIADSIIAHSIIADLIMEHIGAIGHSAMHVLNGRGAGLLEETFSMGRKPVKKNVSSLSTRSLKVIFC